MSKEMTPEVKRQITERPCDTLYGYELAMQSSSPCQCERYREVLRQLMAEYESTCMEEFSRNGVTWEKALEIGMETYKKCEALLADGTN